MEKNYKQLFEGLRAFEPPKNLHANILAHINMARVRAARIKAVLFGLTTLLSFIALIPAFTYLAQQFQQSGFHQYLSLIFSDGSVVLSYWQDYALSIVESIPFTETIIFLCVLFVLLGSARLVVRNARIVFPRILFIR
jgi:hypothetical protein